MNNGVFETIMNDIVADISRINDLPEVKFAVEYPKAPKDVPLRFNTIALGIKSIESNNIFAGNFLYRRHGEYVNSGSLKLRLSIDIYVPNKYGGKACYDIYEKILNQLIFYSGHKVDSIECEELKYNRTTGAFVMRTTASFNILLKENEPMQAYAVEKGESNAD